MFFTAAATTWLGTTVTRGQQPDLTFVYLFLAAAALSAIGAFLLGWPPFLSRFPGLRPPASQISEAIRRGNALLQELLAGAATSDEQYWAGRVCQCDADSQEILTRFAADFLPHYVSEAGFTHGAYRSVPPWTSELAGYVSRRLARLSDILMKV